MHVRSPLSTAASAWLGGRGWRDFGDASGAPVGEGRGPPVCALPAVPALPSLAAGVHHRYEHGTAAVRGQRGETHTSSCPCPCRKLMKAALPLFQILHHIRIYGFRYHLFYPAGIKFSLNAADKTGNYIHNVVHGHNVRSDDALNLSEKNQNMWAEYFVTFSLWRLY